MNIIAFDLGGSGGKVIVANFNDSHLSLTPVHKFEHAPTLINDSLYWNIVSIYQELLTGLKKAITYTNDNITSLGIDSFCNDFAIISPNGQLQSQVYCYRDSRTARIEKDFFKLMAPEHLYHINGNQIALFNTLMQLAAMKLEGDSSLLEQRRILFIPDFLLYCLSGIMTTEYTLASVSQLFDYAENNWSNEILDTFQISKELFAPLSFPGQKIGVTTESINHQLDTKGFSLVSVCEHDTASAFLASIYNEKCAIISCGTWALIGTETDAPIITDYGYKNNIANEGGYPGHHHRLLKNVMGTWIIQEIRAYYQQQGESYSYGEMEALAAKASPFQSYINVDDPIFYSPGNMPEKIREFCRKHNQPIPQTIGELVRAVNEGLAYKFRYNMEKLEHCIQDSFSVINMVGGGAQSDLLCQLTSNICSLPLSAGPVEATAIGNILVQLISAKAIFSIEDGREIVKNSFSIKHFIPDSLHDYEAHYKRFKKIFSLTT